jgi:tRNA A-37 threonylcarbamoyl transferase component Bud32
MFTTEQLKTINAQLALTSDRATFLHVDGHAIVIKRQEPPFQHCGYQILNILANVLGQPLLRGVPAPGGSAAQAIEIARLHALAAAGVSVPKVLQVTPEWFAISFLGKNSIDDLLHHETEKALAYWKSGLHAILELHRLDQNASQCFARNMIWHEGQVSFIDFEDDPIKVMPLASAQARDWLLYLHSTAYILHIDAHQIAQHFLRCLRQDEEDVLLEVMHVARTFGWLRILPNKRKPWGRDVVAAQAAAEVLHLAAKHFKQESKQFDRALQ